MIKLTRPPEPGILKEKSHEWTKALSDAVSKYGSYKDIPDAEKEKLLTRYRHNDIKEALSLSSHGKCAFCECIPSEGGYIEVEHYKPKSIYPASTFDWLNLLPSCSQCNGSKLHHDTVVEPIVNPYDVDPNGIFYFDGISMKPSPGPYFDLAKQTIDVCGLETIRLWKPRAEILVSLTIFTKALVDAMNDLHLADTDKKKSIRLRKLNEALQTIELLMQPSSKFSAFCRHYLVNCEEYRRAKKIILEGAKS